MLTAFLCCKQLSPSQNPRWVLSFLVSHRWHQYKSLCLRTYSLASCQILMRLLGALLKVDALERSASQKICKHSANVRLRKCFLHRCIIWVIAINGTNIWSNLNQNLEKAALKRNIGTQTCLLISQSQFQMQAFHCCRLWCCWELIHICICFAHMVEAITAH